MELIGKPVEMTHEEVTDWSSQSRCKLPEKATDLGKPVTVKSEKKTTTDSQESPYTEGKRDTDRWKGMLQSWPYPKTTRQELDTSRRKKQPKTDLTQNGDTDLTILK